MRIAIVVERFEPGVGGAENAAWQVAHALARGGDEVRVVARRASAAARVPVVRVRVPAAWQPLRVLAFSRMAARAAPRSRHESVYSFSRTRHQDLLRAGGGSHADYLERRHGRRAARLRRLSPRHAVLLRQERRAFGDPSQLVVCVSELVRAQLARRHAIAPERLRVLRNGVDLERFRPQGDARARDRLRAGLATGTGPVWLFAGSGFARKGLDTALRALTPGPPDETLWVAGRDSVRPWQRLAERLGVAGRVRFLGYRSDLPALLAAADALLLPTRYDAFANVCLEAAASGIPVVTSGADGAAELLRGCANVVEDAEDAAGFAAALARLRDPAERTAQGSAARAVAERHDWGTHVEALRALLREQRG